MLNVAAVSAPHWPTEPVEGEHHLNSATPFSLHNAVRMAAARAEAGVGWWGCSNWQTHAGRAGSIFLSDYLPVARKWMDDAIRAIEPNLLLIGSMTISLPGAVELAREAKAQLGAHVLVVFGGKHAIETTAATPNGALLHPASPVRLMESGEIPPVFDLVLAGDAEEAIAAIGELVGARHCVGEPATAVLDSPELESLAAARGDWTACWLRSGSVHHLRSATVPLPYDELTPPAALFPIGQGFPVFGTDLTAHAYSDTSKGCIYSCAFCSESQAINGKIHNLSTAPYRLARQFRAARQAAARRYASASVSVFVEDSILLQGKDAALKCFAKLLQADRCTMPFGAQFVTDMILDPRRQDAFSALARAGLRYVFVGLETADEAIAGGIHKNRSASDAGDGWIDRNRRVIDVLRGHGVDCGFSVLFGLGESQEQRIELLYTLARWQEETGQPRCVSLNWAVRHPLKDMACTEPDTYTGWAVDPNCPRLPYIASLFGEASTRYCMEGGGMCSLTELQELSAAYAALDNAI